MKTVNTYKIVKEKTDFEQINIKSSHAAAVYARQFFFEDIEVYESFFLILLNRQNKTIGYVKIAQGGLNSCVVDVKLIAFYAIKELASGVILVHNHPSGSLTPSDADLTITNKTKQTLSLFDCNVLDHVILTADNFYSFADEGKL